MASLRSSFAPAAENLFAESVQLFWVDGVNIKAASHEAFHDGTASDFNSLATFSGIKLSVLVNDADVVGLGSPVDACKK